MKAPARIPTFYLLSSQAACRQTRACQVCWKVQSIGDGYDVRYGMCSECARAMRGGGE